MYYLIVLEVGCQNGSQTTFLLETVERICFLCFPASTGCLRSLACSHITLTSVSIITPSLALTLLEGLGWAHLKNPGQSLYLKILNNHICQVPFAT